MTAPLSIHEPTGDVRGGVVVIQEAFGVNEHIEDIAARLAAEGWLAIAPHLFHRTGDPKFGYDDFSQVMDHMKALTADGIRADVDDAMVAMADRGIAVAATGIVGFCMGGTVALATAAEREIGAAVTFYGGGIAEGRFGLPSGIESAHHLRAPWLGLYGDLDQGIPIDDVEHLRAAAQTSGQPTEVVRFADAAHGFNCDRRGSYHEASADDAWRRTITWFNNYLVG